MPINKINVTSFIPLSPSSISLGELILKLKVSTNQELKELHKVLSYLKKDNYLQKTKVDHFSLKQTYQAKPLKSSPKKKSQLFKVYDPPVKDFEIICNDFNISENFPKEVVNEVQTFITQINWEKEFSIRKDYTKDFVVTIDGEDAKDLDDAISLIKKEDGYTLFIHIADVSFFVKENSLTDNEASKRGNSTYLINKVVPMLPPSLSNELCSLNPHKKKLTLSVEIDLDLNANIKDYRIFTGVIETSLRLTYDLVQEILDTRDEAHKAYTLLKILEQFTKRVKENRLTQGGLDFDLLEYKIKLDSQENPLDFIPQKRLFSHCIIEECMLLANQVTASFLEKHKTGIFRVHDKPLYEKLEKLYPFLKQLGYRVKPFNSVKDIQNFMAIPKSSEVETIINTQIIQCMSQAVYSPQNIGHFALGFQTYTHFTSPIRRYPDLVVHRQIKTLLQIQKSASCLQKGYLSQISLNCSKTERDSVIVERAMTKRKAIHYLYSHKNDVFHGVISKIIPKGIFVNLVNTNIDGFIAKTRLKNFRFNAILSVFIAPNKKIFSLGLPLKIKIYSLNLEKTFIDFTLENE